MKFGAPSLETRRRIILKWSLFVVVAAVALTIDLVTKEIAEQRLVMGETHEILPFFALQRTANSGAAFGLLGGKTTILIAANVIALLVVATYIFLERRVFLAGICGGMIIGGSLGNLVQRVSGDGRVTDFLKFPSWPNFNMADVFLDVGIAVIVLGLILETVRVWRATGKDARTSR